MSRVNAAVFLTIVLVVAPIEASAGQPPGRCECRSPYDDGVRPGVVWRGTTPPSVDAVVHMLAPVLWFSPDEPLLKQAGVPIPAPLACDTPSTGPVVYYQITTVHLASSERIAEPVESDPAFFQNVRGFALRYFFYYPEDLGLRPHRHDLEGVDVEVQLDHDPDGCTAIRARRITGHAHGLEWYSNILDARADMKFPITVLIEEGKHASSPDRNADGQYTPGYDVNARVHDAWGIRDVLAQGRLLSSGYRAELSKPRRPESRLLPPESSLACTSDAHRSVEPSPASLGHYELRPARDLATCAAGPDADYLERLIDANDFGSTHRVRQRQPGSIEPDKLVSPTGFLAGVALRVDETDTLASFVFRGYDFGEGWIVPRVGFGGRLSAEALITRSASRWLDPYVSFGIEQRDDPNLTQAAPDGSTVTIKQPGAAFVTEAGIKARVQLPGAWRWVTLGSRFGGVRLGVRVNGANRLRNPRFTFEIGPGVW
jgi:hypothetical protein